MTSRSDRRHAQFDMPQRADHVVYIPTNREAELAIKSTLREVAELDSDIRQRTALAVIDNASPAVTQRNRDTVREQSRSFAVPIMFLDEALWTQQRSRICARLAGDRARRANQLLTFAYPSYGAGPIKASLLACALGARTLHRRDSDQVIDDAHSVSPLDLELRWLGTEARDVLNDGTTRVVRAVGSSLIGEPSRDRRDLDAVDDHLGARLDHAHGSSRLRPRSVTERTTDCDGIAVTEDRSGQVEMGICALIDVFRWIPEMPAHSIFGVDYMQKNLVYQSGDVVLHHSRRARHEYDEARALQYSKAAVRTYVLSELRYAYIRRAWNEVNAAIRIADVAALPEQKRADTYASAWRSRAHMVQSGAADILQSYLGVYSDAVRAAKDAGVRERLTWRLDALLQEGASAVADSVRAVHDFIDLVELWPSLCNASWESHGDD